MKTKTALAAVVIAWAGTSIAACGSVDTNPEQLAGGSGGVTQDGGGSGGDSSTAGKGGSAGNGGLAGSGGTGGTGGQAGNAGSAGTLGLGGSDGGVGGAAGAAVSAWAKSYGDAQHDDNSGSIQQTADGGFIAVGTTASFGAGGWDSWILKLDNQGTVAWQKAYGTAKNEWTSSIQQTRDGGYIVAGTKEPLDSTPQNPLPNDVWVFKLNSDGTVVWQKTYGGTGTDSAKSVRQTADGGYVVAGYTESFGLGAWILKLDSNGSVVWQRSYGEAWGESIQQTTDGGYIVAGGSDDFWVVKLDGDGAVVWEKTYGGTDGDWLFSVQQTSDGGYVVAGSTYSFSAGARDIWILKLNSDGTVAWQKAYGGVDFEDGNAIQQTTDGGFIVAGYTLSFGAGGDDCWLLKLNGDGTVVWQKTYGRAGADEWADSVQQTADGGFAVLADKLVPGRMLKADYWVVKLNSDGTVAFNSASGERVTDTHVVPVNTHATVIDVGPAALNTSATVADTNLVVTDTNAQIEQQAP
jgi:hypothetical protein